VVGGKVQSEAGHALLQEFKQRSLADADGEVLAMKEYLKVRDVQVGPPPPPPHTNTLSILKYACIMLYRVYT